MTPSPLTFVQNSGNIARGAFNSTDGDAGRNAAIFYARFMPGVWPIRGNPNNHAFSVRLKTPGARGFSGGDLQFQNTEVHHVTQSQSNLPFAAHPAAKEEAHPAPARRLPSLCRAENARAPHPVRGGGSQRDSTGVLRAHELKRQHRVDAPGSRRKSITISTSSHSSGGAIRLRRRG